jgi:hypothetical protein
MNYESVDEQTVEPKSTINPVLAKSIFSLPLDGGRLAVKFHTPRLLSEEEWDRMLRWLDLMKDDLVEPANP